MIARCNRLEAVDTYSAFMTQVHHSSGIPMPPFSYLAQEAARNLRAHT